MRKIRVLMMVIGAGLLISAPRAALAGGGGSGPCAGFGGGARLVIRDTCFDAIAHFAQTDSTLLVRNDGVLPHSLTAADGSFDTGVLQPGQQMELTLDAAEIVQVYCTLHGTASGNGMAGVLVVGKPTPETAAAAGLAGDVRDALAERDEGLLTQLDTQSRALAALQTELAAVKQAVETPAGTQPLGASTLALLGVVLGGTALAAVVGGWRRTKGEGPATKGGGGVEGG